MTQSTQNSKSILTKALAEENLRVQFDPSAPTAMCDVANRVITLPVWEGLSDAARDLMIGHEIGHALYTPDIDKGKACIGPWTSAAEDIGGNVHALYVQGIMQIVEDVRIERKVKDKYPGLRRDFSTGYRELFDKNFFGTDDIDVSKSSFGDRINLHFKVGVYLAIPFSAEEQEIVDRIANINTFEDTIALTDEVFRFIGGQRQDVQQPKNEQAMMAAPMMNAKEGENDSQGENSVNSNGEQQKGDGTSASGNQQNDKQKNENGSKNNGKSQNGDKSDQSMGSSPMGAGTGLAPELPTMRTQSNFDANQKKTVSKNVYSVNNSTIPDPNPNRMILPCKKAQEMLTTHFQYVRNHGTAYNTIMSRIDAKYSRLITNSNPLIGQLIQQFDMKKAADEQKRTTTSRSGKLDTDRLCLHKITDDIFLNYSTIADGKNHGMVMFIDWSSSMQESTEDVLTQVVMLSQFCKRMAIPFDVYLFSSQYNVLDTHLGIRRGAEDFELGSYKQWESKGKRSSLRKSNNKGGNSTLDTYDDDYRGGQEVLALLHVLSSDMKNNEFNEALKNVYTLGQFVSSPRDLTEGLGISSRVSFTPAGFGQGNTPLDSTIIAAMKIIPEFQKKHSVQIVNTIFLTDGETGYSPISCGGGMNSKSFVYCPFNKKEYDVSKYARSTDALLHIFGDVTGSNTIGFYIIGKAGYCPYWQGDRKEEAKKLNAIGFYDAPSTRYYESFDYITKMTVMDKSNPIVNHGYDRLFVLPNNHDIADMDSVDDVMDTLKSNATFARIRSTFFKAVEKRGNSRAFINRFSDVIANHVKR